MGAVVRSLRGAFLAGASVLAITPPPVTPSGTLGLNYTPTYVPTWSLPATLAAGKADGRIPSDAIDYMSGNGGSPFASLNDWIAACTAAGKSGSIGQDNNQLVLAPTTLARTYIDFPIYGYGSSAPKITFPSPSNRKDGNCWLLGNRFDVKIYGIEFANFEAVFGMAGENLYLYRPDRVTFTASISGTTMTVTSRVGTFIAGQTIRGPGIAPGTTILAFGTNGTTGTGSNNGTYAVSISQTVASTSGLLAGAFFTGAYNTSGDPGWAECDASRAAGFVMRRCASISVSGSPTVSGIQVVRQAAGVDYAWADNSYYDETTTGNAAFAASLDGTAPDLLLGTAVTSATNTSLAAAINANTATTGFSAVVDPNTGRCVILVPSAGGVGRPLDLTITKTGGTLDYDCRGVSVDLSYCKLTDCNNVIIGAMDVTEAGRVDNHKNVARGTWSMVYVTTTRWSDLWAANNDVGDCMATRPNAPGRPAGDGYTSQMPAGSSLSAWNTLWMIGNNNWVHMRYQKVRGTVCMIENNKVENVESLNATDTVNAAVMADVRLTNDSRTIGAQTGGWVSFSNNDVKHLVAINGAIDSNVFYLKGTDAVYRGNRVVEFGAKRVSGPRPNAGSGSEAAFLVTKENGSYVRSSSSKIIVDRNTLVDGPNGLPWIKYEGKPFGFEVTQNRLLRWKNQMDDAVLGDAIGRADVLCSGDATASGTTLTINSIAAGQLRTGMRVVIGSDVRYLKSGSGTSWTMNASLTASGAFTADLSNTVDGGLIRFYGTTGRPKIIGNLFEDVDDNGLGNVIIMHGIITTGFTAADWEISNNIFRKTGSSAFPQWSAGLQLMTVAIDTGQFSNLTASLIGRNEVQDASGTKVGDMTVRYLSKSLSYTDNGNTTAQPFLNECPALAA